MKALLATFAALVVSATPAVASSVQIVPGGTTEEGHRLALDVYSVEDNHIRRYGRAVNFVYHVVDRNGKSIRMRYASTYFCHKGEYSWAIPGAGKNGRDVIVHATSRHSQDLLGFVCAVYNKRNELGNRSIVR